MGEQSSAVEWARTAEIREPVSLGQIEAAILEREPVPLESWSLGQKALVAVSSVTGWVLVVLLVSFTWGACLVGLLLLGMGATSDDPAGWFQVARFLFFVGAVAQLMSVRQWWESGRSRNAFNAVAAGLAVVASGAASVVIMTTDAVPADRWLWLAVVATGVIGVVAFVLSTFSKQEGRQKSRKPPQRGPKKHDMVTRYKKTRVEVLDVLAHRGLMKVDDADCKRLLEMPLGYWDELDGVDAAERRRILELRLVGWREFDESDKRPWRSPSRSQRS